ncbi:alpha/beta hydrolase [Kutzneria albida]|uniref:Trehalose O-mycolyltransferase n=1 Tax=Kutzneria albida DSM 43870 TaxID=1449976 RepID=W5W557_9PSEU|nr:hypothetical protein [Kutzneria albida]AHH96027.1 hypothetical protein KALB_2659 [Kutzneria albida DSM 43870]
MTRRKLLVAAAGIGLLGAGLAVVEEVPLRRALGLVGPDGVVPDLAPVPTSVHRFHSAARGREVTLVAMVPAADLPVCVVLHGRGNNAQGMVELGLPRFLAAQPRSALVAVDGGDSYWVARDPSDDPQAMLREELPGWLTGLGLSAPRAALGISMGCFGGLEYARDLHAAAVLSPALFRSWPDARTIDGFADEAQWAAHEPLRHLDRLPPRLGVWCGLEDPFIDSARLLPATVSAFDHGLHNEGYWRRVLPDALRFLGQVIPG